MELLRLYQIYLRPLLLNVGVRDELGQKFHQKWQTLFAQFE